MIFPQKFENLYKRKLNLKDQFHDKIWSVEDPPETLENANAHP